MSEAFPISNRRCLCRWTEAQGVFRCYARLRPQMAAGGENVFRVHLKRYHPQSFANYGSAIRYACDWSLRTNVPVCLWEPASSSPDVGPFHVRRWNDPWPTEPNHMLCAYTKGRNVPDLTLLFDHPTD